jgi:hypothetical protein
LGERVSRGQKAAGRHTKILAVLDPLAPGSTTGDLIVRYLGTQSELRQRIGALQWSLSAAASQSG